jgi:hypothetical protein
MIRPTKTVALCTLAFALAAAGSPSALSQAAGGEWELSRQGSPPVRLCVAKPERLAQFEHRNASCKLNVIRDSGSDATISYTCPGGSFGQTKISVLTPRSLRIQTQGISGGAPFNYVLQARRMGDCPAH